MRTFTFLIILTFFSCFHGVAQVADGISYQAVALDDEGNEIVGTDSDWNIIEDKQFYVRFSIIEAEPDGEVIYQETHTAHTDPFGMFSLVIGHGDDTGDGRYAVLADIPWGAEKIFLKVELDIDRDDSYRTMDIQQMMSVPFAFRARSAGTLRTIEPEEGHDEDEPVFSVRNSDGEIVFAVYESGVVINIDDDDTKGTRGGFAVGGFSRSKDGEYMEYLRVDPGSVRVTIDDTPDEKGSRGGFAVGGFSSRKDGGVPDYFSLDASSALFALDTDMAKGSRAGFAVGGFSSQKSDPVADYLLVSADSVRVYIEDDPAKGSRGGFAVGGFSSFKQGSFYEYLRIDPGFVRVGIDDDPAKGSRAGFAVGGFSTHSKSDAVDYLHITPSGAQFLLEDDEVKGSRAGFAVGGFSASKGGHYADFLNLSADSARIYLHGDGSGRGGFAVVEADESKGKEYDVLFVAPDRTSVYIREDGKNPAEGFGVFSTDNGLAPERLFAVSSEGTFVATAFESVPVLYTVDVSNLGPTSATSGGIVLSAGGSDITEFGVVISQSPSPTLSAGTVVTATEIFNGVFSVEITGLTAGETYYVRAWAKNNVGTGYGQQVSFETLPL